MEQGIYYTYRYLQTYNNVAAATETEVFKLLNLVSSEVVEKDGWLIVDRKIVNCIIDQIKDKGLRENLYSIHFYL